MIQYALRCTDGHQFDSWFQSADAYEKLAAAGMVVCAVCGVDQVDKAIMAPSVRAARDIAVPAAPDKPLSTPQDPAEQALADLRQKVEQNSDYVGGNFAAEARAMHDGETPERSIYGEAQPAEARALIEDGIPVAPLPFMPQRKTN